MGLIIATPNRSDDATVIAVGSELSSAPATHVQRPQPADLWEATDLNQAWVELQLASVAAIDYAAVLFHNLTASGTVRVRGASTQAKLTDGSAQFDSTARAARSGSPVFDRNHFRLEFSTPESLEFWRFDSI